MAKIEENVGFHQKMAELQEKLRRSEEERRKLEDKFTVMMKSCREDEEARIRALRERYEKFLEDDKRRHERNERILQTLDKIESRATILSAKTERLKILRRHYEAYLIRMYPLWKNHVKYSVEKRFSNQVGVLHKPDTKIITSDSIVSHTNHHNMLPPASSFYPLNPLSALDSKTQLPGTYQPYTFSPHAQDPGLYLDLDSLRSPGRPPSAIPQQHEMPQKFAYNIKDVQGLTVNGTLNNNKPTATLLHNNVRGDHSLIQPDEGGTALTDYIGRAAELLRVPVEKAKEVYDEKRDEGKSTLGLDFGSKLGYSVENEIEQNTSRDLLNISLSDDGILQDEVSKVITNQTLKDPQERSIPQIREDIGLNIVQKALPVPIKDVANVQNMGLLLKESHGLHAAVKETQGDSDAMGNKIPPLRTNQGQGDAYDVENKVPTLKVNQNHQFTVEQGQGDANETHIQRIKFNDSVQDKRQDLGNGEVKSLPSAPDMELIEGSQPEVSSKENLLNQDIDGDKLQQQECAESNIENNQPSIPMYGEGVKQEAKPSERISDIQQQANNVDDLQQDNPQLNVSWKQQQEEFGEVANDQLGESYMEHRVVSEDQLLQDDTVAKHEDNWQQNSILPQEPSEFEPQNTHENGQYNENWQQENVSQQLGNYPIEYEGNAEQGKWPQMGQNEHQTVYDPNMHQNSSNNEQAGEFIENSTLFRNSGQEENWQHQSHDTEINPETQYQGGYAENWLQPGGEQVQQQFENDGQLQPQISGYEQQLSDGNQQQFDSVGQQQQVIGEQQIPYAEHVEQQFNEGGQQQKQFNDDYLQDEQFHDNEQLQEQFSNAGQLQQQFDNIEHVQSQPQEQFDNSEPVQSQLQDQFDNGELVQSQFHNTEQFNNGEQIQSQFHTIEQPQEPFDSVGQIQSQFNNTEQYQQQSDNNEYQKPFDDSEEQQKLDDVDKQGEMGGVYDDNIPEDWEQDDDSWQQRPSNGRNSRRRQEIILEEDELSEQLEDAGGNIQQLGTMPSVQQMGSVETMPEEFQQEPTYDENILATTEVKEPGAMNQQQTGHQRSSVTAYDLKRQVLDDPSDSSSESRAEPNPSFHPGTTKASEGSMEQFRNLLGVATESPSDTAGYSDIDEVEDQLAALVEQSDDHVLLDTKVGGSKPALTLDRNIKETGHQNIIKQEPGKTEVLQPKNDEPSEDSALKLGKGGTPVDNSKSLPRPVAKKLPGLTKVLESDTESLHLDTTGASNVDSDEFDFSSEA